MSQLKFQLLSPIKKDWSELVFSKKKKKFTVDIHTSTKSAFFCSPISQWGSSLQLQPPKEKIVCHFLYFCCLSDLVCDPPYASRFLTRLQPSSSSGSLKHTESARVLMPFGEAVALRTGKEPGHSLLLPYSKDGCLNIVYEGLIQILALSCLIIRAILSVHTVMFRKLNYE